MPLLLNLYARFFPSFPCVFSSISLPAKDFRAYSHYNAAGEDRGPSLSYTSRQSSFVLLKILAFSMVLNHLGIGLPHVSCSQRDLLKYGGVRSWNVTVVLYLRILAGRHKDCRLTILSNMSSSRRTAKCSIAVARGSLFSLSTFSPSTVREKVQHHSQHEVS